MRVVAPYSGADSMAPMLISSSPNISRRLYVSKLVGEPCRESPLKAIALLHHRSSAALIAKLSGAVRTGAPASSSMQKLCSLIRAATKTALLSKETASGRHRMPHRATKMPNDCSMWTPYELCKWLNASRHVQSSAYAKLELEK